MELIFEKNMQGRKGFSLPQSDVPEIHLSLKSVSWMSSGIIPDYPTSIIPSMLSSIR